MSSAERLMVVEAVQAQASQDLVDSENLDKKLIEMSVGILQKVVLDLQLYSNANPSGKLLQLINNVNTNFESLEKSTTKRVLDRFKEVHMQTFQKMIETDRVRLKKGLQTILEALTEGGKIYKSCLILPKFTVNIDKQIGICQGKIARISQSFDSNVALTNNIEGKVIALNNRISSLNSDKDEILRRVGELWNLIAPQMDTMLSNKVDCMKAMAQLVLTKLKDVEIHTYVFSTFIIVFDNLKNGWDSHLRFLKTIFADIFKYV